MSHHYMNVTEAGECQIFKKKGEYYGFRVLKDVKRW